MHNRNHGNGISESQLKELLDSLPRAHAPQNLESQLMQRISAEHLHVAHLLATLSPVSAHPEFDKRLFKAIREHDRTGTIIPGPFAGGTSFATWLNNFGWFRTVIAGTAILVAAGSVAIYNGTQPDTPSGRQDATPVVQQPQSTPSNPVSPNQSTSTMPGAAQVDALNQKEGVVLRQTLPLTVAVQSTTNTPSQEDRTPQTTVQSDAPVIDSDIQSASDIDSTAQRGNHALPSQTVEETGSAATMDRNRADSPTSTIPFGDSVHTGSDVNTGENNATPDSLRVRH